MEEVEVVRKFRLRREDLDLLLSGAFWLFWLSFMISVFNPDRQPHIVFILIAIDLGILFLLFIYVWKKYKSRLYDRYFLDGNCLLKLRHGELKFELPFENIVSLYAYSKKDREGSIVFFVEEKSRNYFTTYFYWSRNGKNFSIHRQQYKINLAVDRKKLITRIYNVNPDLNIIVSKS